MYVLFIAHVYTVHCTCMYFSLYMYVLFIVHVCTFHCTCIYSSLYMYVLFIVHVYTVHYTYMYFSLHIYILFIVHVCTVHYTYMYCSFTCMYSSLYMLFSSTPHFIFLYLWPKNKTVCSNMWPSFLIDSFVKYWIHCFTTLKLIES